jgi:dTDP-3-amino-3,4,6-trideoxy-alpha-D-glucose transaminase
MTTVSISIPFNNLHPLHQRLAGPLAEASQRVLNSGWFILGPEVEAFERAFAAYHGVRHAVGVANGTDAIELALRAAGITNANDEVISVAHTAAATICAIERAGATPVLVDIDPHTLTIDPAAVAAAITPRTRAIIPVHIYGQAADLSALRALADKNHLLLMEDCAQAHGALFNGQKAGTFGQMASFSFYPTKNLGALGDGGAVITNDDGYAAKLRSLRNYGQTVRYHHAEAGINSRLDELQAALLNVKLQTLDACNAERRGLAAAYDAALNGLPNLATPFARNAAEHVYHLYVVRTRARDALLEALKTRGIGTLIHYPIPNHLQPAYAGLGMKAGSLPVTEQAANEILSLPLYIGLTTDHVARVSEAIADSLTELA